jgi:hypothetical protein
MVLLKSNYRQFAPFGFHQKMNRRSRVSLTKWRALQVHKANSARNYSIKVVLSHHLWCRRTKSFAARAKARQFG